MHKRELKEMRWKAVAPQPVLLLFFFLDFYLRAGRRAIIRCPSQGGQRSKRSRRRRRRWRISRKTGPRDRVQGNLFKLLITRAPRGDKCGGGKIFQRRDTLVVHFFPASIQSVTYVQRGGKNKKALQRRSFSPIRFTGLEIKVLLPLPVKGCRRRRRGKERKDALESLLKDIPVMRRRG